MSDIETILQPAAVACPNSLREVNRAKCEHLLNVGIFFDGTDNNSNTKVRDVDTNIWKLSRAYKHLPLRGHFRLYVSGVGTPFTELEKKKAEGGGGPFGAGGEARILYGLLQVINSCYAAIHGKRHEHFDKSTLSALCSNARLPDSAEGASRPLSSEERILQGFGLRQGLDGASEQVRQDFFRKQSAQLRDLLTDRKTRPTVNSIYLDVFGFSRGAAQARVFVNWLHRYMLLGGQLFGVPSYVRMLGLFDTVASVGRSDAAWGSGHGAWATAENLRIHPQVKNCVHYVALHELRTNFPSDSVRVGESLPKNCHEHVVPGAHSDVGGGYAPLDQGKGVRLLRGTLFPTANPELRLSNLSLNEMYDAAIRSCKGHPYIPWLRVDEDDVLKQSFGRAQREKIREEVAAYFANCELPASLPLHMALREHGARYLAWRYLVNQAKRFDKLASVERAEMYPSTYKYYKEGQKIFGKQIEAMEGGKFAAEWHPKARVVFQQVKGLAKDQPNVLLKLGAFFDDWVHDSYAGFIGKFYEDENGEPTTWGPLTHYAAENDGYVRWRNLYQGSDDGLNE